MEALRSINESIPAGIGLTSPLTPIPVAGAAQEWPACRLTFAAPFSCTYCSRQGGRRHLISGAQFRGRGRQSQRHGVRASKPAAGIYRLLAVQNSASARANHARFAAFQTLVRLHFLRAAAGAAVEGDQLAALGVELPFSDNYPFMKATEIGRAHV